MFWTVPLSIIRSFPLYTQQRYMLYRFADSLRAGSGWNSWWWMEELSKTCRVSFQNKKCWEISASSWFYYKKFITMHGLMNVTYFEHTWKYFPPQNLVWFAELGGEKETFIVTWSYCVLWLKFVHCICGLTWFFFSMTPIYHQFLKKFICCEVVVTSLWLVLVTISLSIWLVNCEHDEHHCTGCCLTGG
jgi:hypothetical protein